MTFLPTMTKVVATNPSWIKSSFIYTTNTNNVSMIEAQLINKVDTADDILYSITIIYMTLGRTTTITSSSSKKKGEKRKEEEVEEEKKKKEEEKI